MLTGMRGFMTHGDVKQDACLKNKTEDHACLKNKTEDMVLGLGLGLRSYKVMVKFSHK
ncbi:hypothetical protein Tco_1325024, partial [Tanacetum coccineum]